MSYIVYREEEERRAGGILVIQLSGLPVKIQVTSCKFEEVGQGTCRILHITQFTEKSANRQTVLTCI